MEALKAFGDWQTFPRNDAAAAISNDGRWSRPPHPVTWKMMPRMAAPLALRRDAKSGLTAVLMSRPNDCFAVSMPYGEEGHRSVYFSLFGGDLKAGQKASAGARLVIGKDITDDRAMELYRAYLKGIHFDTAFVATTMKDSRVFQMARAARLPIHARRIADNEQNHSSQPHRLRYRPAAGAADRACTRPMRRHRQASPTSSSFSPTIWDQGTSVASGSRCSAPLAWIAWPRKGRGFPNSTAARASAPPAGRL